MFTGIVESIGTITNLQNEGKNITFTIASEISDQMKIDQSLSHDGVCLTVVDVQPGRHVVTAIDETLSRTNLGDLVIGKEVNLERAMKPNARLDGHMVQGHVDTIGVCTGIEERDGSWIFNFEYPLTAERLLVDKGSICVSGVSLTVVSPKEIGAKGYFSVAIIPYTFQHTIFHQLQLHDKVNLEFDVIGKYVSKYMAVFGKG